VSYINTSEYQYINDKTEAVLKTDFSCLSSICSYDEKKYKNMVESWFNKEIEKLNLEENALICTGDTIFPLWTGVSFKLPVTLYQLWLASRSKDIIIVNPDNEKLLAVFNEEYKYMQKGFQNQPPSVLSILCSRFSR